MTKDELEEIIKNDPYFQERENISPFHERLHLREVNFCCPLCGRSLISSKQKKNNKMYEIAHIYPNRPTIQQYLTFYGLERLGDTTESFNNKIALCKSCHSNYDYKTSKEEYLRLLNIKKQRLQSTEARESIDNLSLEEQLHFLIEAIVKSSDEQLGNLNYSPVSVAKKMNKDSSLLKSKICGYVEKYFTFIRDCLSEHDGKNGFQLEALSLQMKTCFLRLRNCSDQSTIFNSIVDFIKNRTGSTSVEACEALVSFFVQNCEVFDEIAE